MVTKKNFLLFLLLYFIQSIVPQLAQAQNEKDFSINGLPVIHINLVKTGTITKEIKLEATMRIENAYGSTYDEDQLYNGLIEIAGRGNSTWGMPKKPYKVGLITGDGKDNPSALLGMPADEDWVLIANYSDKSMLRIPVAYYLGNAIGMDYSPRLRFVEVYLNEEYMGLYNLCEKIKKSDSRVNIKKLTDSDKDQVEPNVTGGYLVEIDQLSKLNPDDKYVTSNLPVLFAFKYPKKKKITVDQMEWFRRYVDSVESALYGPDFKDPDKGYRKYLDVGSFVDWYLVNEFAKNTDAIFFSSVYMHKDRNKKLMMGPLWDFDIGFGNVDYNSNYLENGFWIRNSVWIKRLFEDNYFSRKVSDRYDELKPVFDSMPQKIKNVADFLKRTGAIDRNFERWPVLGIHVWPNYPPFPSTYDGEVQRLTDWFKERDDWMNIYLPINKDEQCERLKNTKPHISITDIDKFEREDTARIKTTFGYAHYYWNGKDQAENILSASLGGKYWVQVEDNNGCKSLTSDTLYFVASGTITVDSFNFVYNGMPRLLQTSTIPEGLTVKYTYNGDTIPPVVPGEYQVVATINSPTYRGTLDTVLYINKVPQKINFSQLPLVIYLSDKVLLNATASSGLPVQYTLSGKGEIRQDYLYPEKTGEIIISATQRGNDFYEPSDTLSQNVWAEYKNNFKKNLQIFPSPFQSSVTLIYPYAEQTKLKLYSNRGKILREYTLKGNTKTLNLGFLPKGIYMLHFSSSKGDGIYKVIKL